MSRDSIQIEREDGKTKILEIVLKVGCPLSLKQAAIYLQLSERTILRYVERNGLPVHRTTRQLRFYREELDTWLKSRGADIASEEV